MNCMLYAVTWRLQPHALPTQVGVEGRPLQLVEQEALCAVVSAHERCPPPNEANLQAYGAALNALEDAFDLVPMRFGACQPHSGALRAWLAEEQEAYAAVLRRVAGCVEIGLRYRAAQDEPAPAIAVERGPGHAYLASRGHPRARDPALDAAGRNIEAALAGLHCGCCFDPAANGLAGLSFLVPRVRVEAFIARSRELAREHDGLLYLTGPWPPYSFANPNDTRAARRADAWH